MIRPAQEKIKRKNHTNMTLFSLICCCEFCIIKGGDKMRHTMLSSKPSRRRVSLKVKLTSDTIKVRGVASLNRLVDLREAIDEIIADAAAKLEEEQVDAEEER